MKKGRRLFAIFMATVMVLALLPTAAFAHDEIIDEETEALEVLGAIASDETESDLAEEADEEVDGFEGDELEDIEDAAPEAVENTEDIAPEEDIETEDAVVEMYAADYGSAEEAPLQSKYTVHRTKAFEEGKGTLLLEETGDRGKAPALDEEVLTDYGRYVIVGYNEVGNMEIPALPNVPNGFDIKVYVIDATSKASIVFKFVDEDGAKIKLPEGYAVRYTAEIKFDPFGSAVKVSGKTIGTDPTYRAFTNYYNDVQFEFGEIDVPGYTYTVNIENIEELSGEPGFARRSGETSYYTNKISSDQPDVDDTIITVGCKGEKAETYTVTWLNYDGNTFGTATVNKGKPIPEECPEGTPNHESYTFDGWNWDEAVEENGIFTVRAKWIEPHLVIFKADGAATQQHEQTVKHGATAIEPETKPEKDGHTFRFWTSDGETAFNFSTPITENITLTAKWIAEKCTVTWKNGEETVATDKVDYGTTVTAPETELSREGYRFDGWDFDFETKITEDTTISAKWVKQVTHTWKNGEETVDSKTADAGAEVEAPANLTRSGYTFNGWTSTTDGWGNVTYTARWTANPPSGGGSTGGGSTIGGGPTGGGNDEPIGGGEGNDPADEGNDPADEGNDPNENGEDENGGLIDIGDEGTALADRPFPFIDVNKNDWFYNDVYTVWEKEIMNGATATAFEPGTITTRSMLVTILYRLEGCPEVTELSKFVDVAENEYYTDAIAWAAANGIVKGETEDSFSPNGIVLREQTAAILYRYAKYKGIDVSVEASEMAFEDADSISEYAQDAMLWAVSTGLIKGVSEDRLAPQNGTERCQMATMLVRFMNLTETAEGEADEQ